MPSFSATSICADGLDTQGFTGIIEHDRGTKELIITDTLISNLEIAQHRATSELLQGAYIEKWIYIKTVITTNLKQNDIILFKNKKWIVKEINISYNPPELIQTIKGVRYE